MTHTLLESRLCLCQYLVVSFQTIKGKKKKKTFNTIIYIMLLGSRPYLTKQKRNEAGHPFFKPTPNLNISARMS